MQTQRQQTFNAPAAEIVPPPKPRAENQTENPTAGSDSWDVHGQGFILLHYRPPGEQMLLRLNTIFVSKFGAQRA